MNKLTPEPQICDESSKVGRISLIIIIIKKTNKPPPSPPLPAPLRPSGASEIISSVPDTQ